MRSRTSIANAAFFAVVLDLLLLRFTYNKLGMAALAEAVFKARQSVTFRVMSNYKSCLPSNYAGAATSTEIGLELRSK